LAAYYFYTMPNIAPFGDPAWLTQYEAPDRQDDRRDMERLYSALLKRWRTVAAVAGGFVALVAVATILTPKSYTTTVRLLAGRSDTSLAPSGDSTTLPVLNALVLQSGVQSAETFATLAQQRDTAATVIKQLNLSMTPKEVLGRVSVRPIANTALLNLNVSGRTSDESARMANAFAQAFIDEERDFVRSEAVSAVGYLSKELPSARERMRATATQLAQFQSAHGYMDATSHEQDVVSRVSTIDQRVDQLAVDASEAKALLESTSSQMGALSITVNSAQQVQRNPVSSDLRSKLAEVETELAEAQQRYTPEHPTVISLRQQRAALVAQIEAQPSAVVSETTVAPNPLYQSLQQQAATYRARIQGDQAQVRSLLSERRAYRTDVKSLPQQTVQFATIQEEAKRAGNVYEALEQKYNDALVASSTAISDIIIVQAASADAAIKRPSLGTNLAIALAVGLLLGIALAYVLDAIERRAAGGNVAGLLGLPVVARIPEFAVKNPPMIPTVQAMTVEAFLHLCVALHHTNKRRMRTLAVLSARRGEGKSTVALNLAKSLSTLNPGVLLIDADLRQPTLHEKTGLPNTAGLSNVLEGSMSMPEAIQHLAPGLDVLTSGPDSPAPVRLLNSQFEVMLSKARMAYATVVVDTPALSAVSDALVIASHADASLLVVAPGGTSESDARKAAEQLKLFGIDNVLGIVLNKDVVTISAYDDYFVRMRALAAGSA
jgi:polysaccharide biosynthesis transport protein